MKIQPSYAVAVLLFLSCFATTYYYEIADVFLPDSLDGSSSRRAQTAAFADVHPFTRDLKGAADIRVDRTSIRNWGCGRTDTPFIFVHVGE